ncbi:c-type cytochrome [Lujinxingia vulgaris]|uniref:Cytochrome c oxidase subunit 2 n=2 Tax=Lujinxingia vulgaris TaxID=2600176 RepID=A0A5C6XMB8_9DELT|nr:c-type cytochrome [Lujinxingia vulgaris]
MNASTSSQPSQMLGLAPSTNGNLMSKKTMSGYFNPRHLKRAALLVALTLALLIPATAFAVPGSGEFIAHYTQNGREMTGLYNMIAKICLGVLILVEVVLVAAIFKFRRRSDDERPVQNHGNLVLEIGWTTAAALFQIWIGVATINVMFATEVIPDDIDMTVEAVAYQWDWQFVYPDHGGLVHSDLVVPANTNVKLEVTSRDVIHSIFVPDLGIKMDAVPGRFNYWWFRADGPVNQVRVDEFATVERQEREYVTTRPDFMQTRPDATAKNTSGLERRVTYLGRSRTVEEVSPYAKYSAIEYQGTCTELCGLGHWDMYFRAVVMTPSSFRQWVFDMQNAVTEANGPDVFAARCATCHGESGQGQGDQFPTLVGAARVVEEGQKDSHIQLVLQGKGVMPAFGQILNDAEVTAVVNHERLSWGNAGGEVTDEDVARVRESLGLPPFPAGGVEPTPTPDLMAAGERIFESCVSCHGRDGQGPDYIPSLAGNSKVNGDVAALAELLIKGADSDQWPGEKTPVARSMTDFQLASLLTYLRGSFGNESDPVQPGDIERIRRDMN